MTSNVAITKIRTGKGDLGDTRLGVKNYRKGHPMVAYSAALDLVQAHTIALPKQWGDFQPRETLQELLFRLGATIGGKHAKSQELALVEITKYLDSQVEYISSGLKPLNSFIRCTEQNAPFHMLRAHIRMAESGCFAARDRMELEAKNEAPNLIAMLDVSGKALNVASDWVFAFAWVYSVQGDSGTVPTHAQWVPWEEDRLKELNEC